MGQPLFLLPRRPWFVVLAIVLIALWVGVGCVAHGSAAVDAAYRGDLAAARDAYDALGEPDRDTLRAIAGTILARHAQGRDARGSRAAFAELSRAGTRARRLLERLVFKGNRLLVKARALAGLTRLGDLPAAQTLRALSRRAKGEVLLLAVPHFDVEEDLDRLLALALHPRAGLRAAAAARLSGAATGADMTLLLRGLARRDPAPAVRAAAFAALATRAKRDGDGEQLLPVFEHGLSDAEQSVAMAAARGLPSLGGTAANARLAMLIGGDVLPHSLEAARMLLGASNSTAAELTAARGLLQRALLHRSDKRRAQAAVAWASVPPTLRPTGRLEEALEVEKAGWVRLQLALTLGASNGAAAAALRKLMAGDRMDAVTAATALAVSGAGDGLSRLEALQKTGSPTLRATIARSLIRRLDRAHEARALLFDEHRGVRLAAAGAVLARD